jgi:hypothetical protein
MRAILAGSAVIALLMTAACGNAGSSATGSGEGLAEQSAPAMDAGASASDVADESPSGAAKPATGQERRPSASNPLPAPAPAPAPQVPLPQLSYSHTASLRLPPDRLIEVMRAHQRTCREAGPALCQVVGASSQDTDGAVEAHLSLRAVPGWMDTFRESLPEGVEAAGGRVLSMRTDTEEVGGQIVDIEGRLAALRLQRSRLIATIETTRANMAERLTAEGQLAEVQAQIDALTGNRVALQRSVILSRLEIGYTTGMGALAVPVVSEKLAEAWRLARASFAGTLTTTATLLAVFGPPVLVLGPFAVGGWLAVRRLRARTARRRAGALATDGAVA